MNEQSAITITCANCGREQQENYKFCSRCGARNLDRFKKETKDNKLFQQNLRLLAAYLLVSVVSIIAYYFTEETVIMIAIGAVFFAAIDIVFASLQPKTWAYLRIPRPAIRPLLLIITVCIVSAVVVSYSMDGLNQFFFNESIRSLTIFNQENYAVFHAIVLLSLFPAFFEELAFRGFVFDNLKVISGEKSAIWGSAAIFALVHFSLLGLVWLFPFGLLLGYLRYKHNTIVYGMIGHFTHNTVVTLLEYFQLF